MRQHGIERLESRRNKPPSPARPLRPTLLATFQLVTQFPYDPRRTIRLLFAILFCWQIPHFLALALIYRKDYARGGFKMMPLVRSMAYTGAHMIGFSLALIAASLALYAVAGGSMIYVIGSTLLGTTMLAASVVAARQPAVKYARRLLITSVVYLPALLFLILFDRVIA